MNVLEAINARRSIRAFESAEISEETVEKLIDVAAWAPWVGNIQQWEFIVVRKQKTKRKLAEAAWNQSFAEKAPVIVVVCADEVQSAQ